MGQFDLVGLKHRDRVLAALNHEQPDRCLMQVGFTPGFASRLQADLGIPDAAMVNTVTETPYSSL